MVWHPQVHVATLLTVIFSSGFCDTDGDDFLCPFACPGFLPDFTRLFCGTILYPFVEDGLQLLLLSFATFI